MRPDTQLIQRYLLGQLGHEETQRLERTYFLDDEVFEQVLIAEEDLIDAYVRGQLPPPEVALFERRFLASADGRARVELARLLLAEADSR